MNRATTNKPHPVATERHVAKLYANHGRPIFAKTVSRNAPCGCGSGRKQKHCCGVETRYFTPKTPI